MLTRMRVWNSSRVFSINRGYDEKWKGGVVVGERRLMLQEEKPLVVLVNETLNENKN